MCFLAINTLDLLQPIVEVRSGFVSRITTGAALPLGADAVVQVEDTELVQATANGEEEAVVRILSTIPPGHDVRPVGVDIAKGEQVLKRFETLGPAELGLLAAIGVTKVNIIAPPTVAVLSTGNEVSRCWYLVNGQRVFSLVWACSCRPQGVCWR